MLSIPKSTCSDFIIDGMVEGSCNNLDLPEVKRKHIAPAWMLGNECSGDSSGSRIRKERVKHGLSIQEVAEIINMSAESLRYIESGKPASLATLGKLSNVLKVPIEYLGCFDFLPENSLGEKIKKIRLSKGLTIKDMAEMINVNPRLLSAWEKEQKIPSPEYLELLKEKTGLKL